MNRPDNRKIPTKKEYDAGIDQFIREETNKDDSRFLIAFVQKHKLSVHWSDISQWWVVQQWGVGRNRVIKDFTANTLAAAIRKAKRN